MMDKIKRILIIVITIIDFLDSLVIIKEEIMII